MKNMLETVCVALAMFSRLPVPHVQWNARNTRDMLCAFPLVGALSGLALWGFLSLHAALGLGPAVRAAGVTLLPIALTGGVHLDGFCDVCDAMAAHAPPERRREILKDPHCGAFAVLALCCWLLAAFALAWELPAGGRTALALGLCAVLSRALSGLAVLRFPAAGKPGLLHTFREAAGDGRRQTALLLVWAAACAAALVLLFGPAGAGALCAALLCLLWLQIRARRAFGGMSGDLSGWFLQVCELAMLAALILLDWKVLL